MRSLSKIFLAVPLLALTTPLLAGVLVNSPANGSTVTGPVQYTATATATTCSKGVGSMGVYVDDKLIYVANGASLNASVPVSLGKHGTVVEEWDHCGGASYSSLTITVVAPTAPMPTFSLAPGTYTSAQSVTLSDATAGATIYYTTDGSTPTTFSAKYAGAISVTSTETIESIAVAAGYSNSAIAAANYTITPPAVTPTFSLAPGTYTSAQSVTLSDAMAGATICYTIDGSTPTTASTRYAGAISVTATETIQAVAVAAGYSNSAVASANYTITPPAAPPTFSLAANTYTSAQVVTLSDVTAGATIYYTTNGSTPTTASTKYAGALSVTSTETIQAIAVAAGYSNSAVASANYTITPPAATPTFSLAPGTYTSVQSVTLSDATAGATIYYTTDGSTPTTSSAKYAGAISVTSTETIEAIAVAAGYSNSTLASANYTITLPAATPTFSLVPGTYTSAQSVTLSDVTAGVTIYYTTNGSAPTTSSSKYAGTVSVTSTETIEAIAVAAGYSNSAVASANYTITPPAATPTFSLAASTYTSAQSVTLSDATAGATIYFTTDGSTPTTSSAKYAGAISVTSTETIEAIAVAAGYSNSAVASANYTITPPAATPTFSLAASTYTSAQSVTLSDATAGATIYYTTNGTTPTTASTKYAGAISVTATETLEAIATAPGYSTSTVASASYTITPPAATPTFSLAASTYTSVQSVTLSDATAGATIYYTTNGTTPTTASTKYAGAISVTATETLEAIATAPGYSTSTVASASYTITPPAATPTFSLAASTYTSAQSVTLSDVTAGATIYYTTNGSTPTTSSSKYVGAISVTSTETIEAIAVAAGYSTSAVASASFTITPPAATPTFSLAPGTYTSAESVTMSDATAAATIYYTTNGLTPTTSSTRYSGAISVTGTETIEAIAVAAGCSNSAVASVTYTLSLAAATPMFSLAAGTYTSAQSVTLSDATAAATIYYTTNGSGPTTSSTKYSGAISVKATEVIQAIAVASGYTNSGFARADYVIKAPAGPSVPAGAIVASGLHLLPNWKYNHDAGTSGSSLGQMSLVTTPTLSGKTAEFDTSYLDWGGEIYYRSFAMDTASTNFVYDAQVWIAEGSQVGNLEMDMNQVMANGETVIYGFQCDGDHGTWDYSGNTGALGTSHISWFHSSEPCNPADWSTNTWHHIQISYSRDEVGNVTYNGVWLDGVETVIGATVPSADALGWAKGDLLTNFQIDGVGSSGASVVYLDNLTISRW